MQAFAAFLLLGCVLSLHAAPIDKKSALKIASDFMSENNLQKTKGLGRHIEKYERVYAINFTSGKLQKGFVLVADDDQLPAPVLAFSKEGRFDINNGTMQSVMRRYSAEIEQAAFNQPFQVEDTTVYYRRKQSECAPLLPSVSWTQRFPYNFYMPQDADGKNSYTGCAAIAMAELMNYYKYPAHGTGIHVYFKKTQKGKQLNIITEYDSLAIDWGNIVERYDDAMQVAGGIAQLLYYCAVASESSFGSDGSVSYVWPAYVAMFKYFGFHPELSHLRKEADFTDEQLLQFLYKEVEQKRPVLCCGHNHFYICDGFIDDYFHFDWGWGGAMNGYFKLSALPAGVNNFQLTPYMIAKAHPQHFGERHKEVVLAQAGTLRQHISAEEAGALTSLSVSGPLNGIDIQLLRRMAGVTDNPFQQAGELRVLDLSKAELVDDYETPYFCRDLRKARWRRVLRHRQSGESWTFDFATMSDSDWQRFCEMGGTTHWNKEWKFVKEGGAYYLQYHVRQGVIGEYLFAGCKNLRQIRLPEAAEIIRENAFLDCVMLRQADIPSHVALLQPKAWSGCVSLEAFAVAADNPRYGVADGVLYDKPLTTLVCYPPYRRGFSYKPVSSTRRIASDAFLSPLLLISVELPGLVYEIAPNAFVSCNVLKSVRLPKDVIQVGEGAFTRCGELSEVHMPGRLVEKMSEMFVQCPKLNMQ